MLKTYVATFFTHFDAVTFAKQLGQKGLEAQPMPVPRRLSSSCGTCVQFKLSDNPLTLCGETIEQIAEVTDGGYTTLWKND